MYARLEDPATIPYSNAQYRILINWRAPHGFVLYNAYSTLAALTLLGRLDLYMMYAVNVYYLCIP